MVIGPGWIDASDTRGFRRLDDPDDYVRLEVERSLAMNKRIDPVLIKEARMPRRSEIPASIAAVADVAAAELGPGPAFEAGASRLIADLEPDLWRTRTQPPPGNRSRPPPVPSS